MERQYLDLLEETLQAPVRQTRNAAVRSVFSRHLHCNLKPFPLLTTKIVYFKGVVEELAWFLRGSTDVEELKSKGVHIWDANAEVNGGKLGPIYGKQWRDFAGVDQIKYVIDNIRNNPFSRRHFFSAWNPSELGQMALPPCHVSYQFYVDNHDALHCSVYQRSADVFLGLPFNISSSALLTYLIAAETGKDVGTLTMNIGDAHLYTQHEEAARTQLTRSILPMPLLEVKTRNTYLKDVTAQDITLINYRSHGKIKAKMIA